MENLNIPETKVTNITSVSTEPVAVSVPGNSRGGLFSSRWVIYFIVSLILVAVIAAGFWLWQNKKNPQLPMQNQRESQTSSESPVADASGQTPLPISGINKYDNSILPPGLLADMPEINSSVKVLINQSMLINNKQQSVRAFVSKETADGAVKEYLSYLTAHGWETTQKQDGDYTVLTANKTNSGVTYVHVTGTDSRASGTVVTVLMVQ